MDTKSDRFVALLEWVIARIQVFLAFTNRVWTSLWSLNVYDLRSPILAGIATGLVAGDISTILDAILPQSALALTDPGFLVLVIAVSLFVLVPILIGRFQWGFRARQLWLFATGYILVLLVFTSARNEVTPRWAVVFETIYISSMTILVLRGLWNSIPEDTQYFLRESVFELKVRRQVRRAFFLCLDLVAILTVVPLFYSVSSHLSQQEFVRIATRLSILLGLSWMLIWVYRWLRDWTTTWLGFEKWAVKEFGSTEKAMAAGYGLTFFVPSCIRLLAGLVVTVMGPVLFRGAISLSAPWVYTHATPILQEFAARIASLVA